MVAVKMRSGSPFEHVVAWYTRHGEWQRRAAIAIVVFLLSHSLLSVWPIADSQVLILWSLLAGLATLWQPRISLFGVLIGLAAGMIYYSGSLALAFAVLPILGLILPRVSDTPLKLVLLLAAPLAFQHWWFFLPALLLGLVYRRGGTLPAAFGAVFGLTVDWLEGIHIIGVLPPHAPIVASTPLATPLFTWMGNNLQLPNWPALVEISSGIQPYVVTAITAVIIVAIVAQVSGVLRRGRGVRDDALAIGITSTGALIAWVLAADGFHPGTAVGLALLPPTYLAAAAALLVGRLFPSAPAVRKGADQETGTESTEASSARTLRKATWDDIAGYTDVKQELLEAILPYTDSAVRRKLEEQGLPLVRGILLYGPPGTGKTLIARVLASESGMNFIPVSGPEFFSKWVGESEARLRKLFQEARDHAPCLVFFDEVESFLPPRDRMDGSGAGQSSQRVVATFLSEMDGLTERGDLFVVAATNYPDQIDAAAIRPGRFDEVIFVPPPDAEARRAIFGHALRDRADVGTIDVEKVVAMTERFTAADIFGVVTNAYRAAAHRDAPVTQEELEALLHQTKPTVSLQMLDRYEKLADRYARRSAIAEHAEVVTHEHLGWEDIGGMEPVKAALKEAVELPLLHPERFREWGVQPPKGVLLFGPPGCGKTMFAKVVSDTAKVRFYTVNGPELLGGGPGAAEERLRHLFEAARENRPAVVFFDEIDAIAGSRDSLLSRMQGTIVQQLLTLIDGKEALSGVVVIAATNRPDQLDSALLRPGRFDRLIYVPLPDEESRRAQWTKHLSGKPGAQSIDVSALAEASEGYTGAEIRHVANQVALAKIKASLGSPDAEVSLTTEDVLEGLRQVVPQVSHEEVAAYEAIAQGLSR